MENIFNCRFLVGKSGSGKSTLWDRLSTMDAAYEAELFIKGKKITVKNTDELAAIINEHIGFIFQFNYLLPKFSCLKKIMIPTRKFGNYCHQEIEYRAYEKLKILGLEDQVTEKYY